MKNPEDLFDHIEDVEVYTYHLTDGSYIIAEEVDFEEENGVLYVVLPTKLERTEYGFKFAIYTISEMDGVTELNTNSIVTRTEAPFALKCDYLRYIISNKLKQDMLEEELTELLEKEYNLFDAFDSKDDKPHNKRFDWKPENN